MEDRHCEMQREHILEKIDRNETRLNNHSERIDKLEQYRSSNIEQIKSLIEQVHSLIVTMRWFIGLLIGAFVSFFFYAVQNGIFK